MRGKNRKRRRVDEPVPPVSTVAQDEISTLSLMHFDSEKREFLKSMEVEWQTLLKNHAAWVLFLEETVQARAGRIVRWTLVGCVRGGSQTKAGHRGAVQRHDLSLRFFTDPDLRNIESHSPSLTREGFMCLRRRVVVRVVMLTCSCVSANKKRIEQSNKKRSKKQTGKTSKTARIPDPTRLADDLTPTRHEVGDIGRASPCQDCPVCGAYVQSKLVCGFSGCVGARWSEDRRYAGGIVRVRGRCLGAVGSQSF